MINRLLLAACMLFCCATAQADSPQVLLRAYAQQAQAADPGFSGFSEERGRAFYYAEHAQPDGTAYACASCHHQDPRKEQFAHHDKIPCRACHFPSQRYTQGHVIRRQLLPLAPTANSARFVDLARSDMWFAKNCEFVLGRDCTPQEKGDLISWLLTLPAE